MDKDRVDKEQSTGADRATVSRSGAKSPARNTVMEATLTSAGVGGLAGLLAGVVWGGVGGRLAMRVLVLTSDERVRGLTSDDGFEIGVVSASTIVLLIFTAVLGTIGGFAYGLLRVLLRGPTWLVAIAVAIAVASGEGALFVTADGIDFQVLEPLWLAIGLFVLIGAAWGATVVVVTEWLLRRPGVFHELHASQVDRRYGGTIGATLGWLALAAITTAGLVDLSRDLNRLT